ncbi:MAG: Rieske (2Fe-2S) protein [Actinomycetes bacterium]
MSFDRIHPAAPADDPRGLTRRRVLQGAASVGAIGVAGTVLAACGSDDVPGSTSSGGSSSAPAETSAGSGDGAIASTADVPVGGGLILESPEAIVITQAAEGDFKAFTAICTHQQCVVGAVTDNVIMCPCHGSTYDASTGEPTGGPAPSALAPIQITVEGDQILLA